MSRALHITNGDSAVSAMRAGGVEGDFLPWRDVLHEGPVPGGLSLAELGDMRARFLADAGLGQLDELKCDFVRRDDALRQFIDYDEVVLWFEWDLYDQLQLLQLLHFFSGAENENFAPAGTRLLIVEFKGYFGGLPPDQFPALYVSRAEVSREMLERGKTAWTAFTSSNPRAIEASVHEKSAVLPFLHGAFIRHLEEFPSTTNGLSRSERQILEAVADRPLSFPDVFRRASMREERIFCGDAITALHVERLSQANEPLLAHPSVKRSDSSRTSGDLSGFGSAQIALTQAGRAVLAGEADWIEMGGSDRWLGGVHLDGGNVRWRWDPEAGALRDGIHVET